MPQLFLVRHGEPTLKGTMLGRLDPDLSEDGRRAAETALSQLEAAIVYVSPLRRAQETASFLPASIPRVTLPDLAEVALGEWEGLTWAEVSVKWPELAQQKMERWFETPSPGGEPWEEVTARAARALERIRQGPFPAVAVAHHGINSMLSALITGGDPHTHVQSYCQVFIHEL